MFCKYCGNELPEQANFCTSCGKITEERGDDIVVEAVAPTATPDPDWAALEAEREARLEAERDEMGGSILKLAILGLAFGISVWLSLLGIIFSAIARSKIKQYVSRFGETRGRASVGKGLSIAGLAVSITFTCFIALFIVLLIAGLGATLELLPPYVYY